MSAVEDYLIDMGGQETTTIRFERADATDPNIAGTLIDIDLQTFTEATFSRFAATALQRHGQVFLLRHESVVIGTAVCIRSFDAPAEALILSMGILHGWRGRGLGRRFVTSVIRSLESDGFEAVNLEVVATNERALHIYRALGFEQLGETQGASPRSRVLLLRRPLGVGSSRNVRSVG